MSGDIFRPIEEIREGRPAFRRAESIWRVQFRIWYAIMLRDMRSRFFGNGLGYIVILLWPIMHMSILIVIHAYRGTGYLYGDSLMAYLTSGFLPVFTFVYMSRFTVYAVALNAPLMAFPAVKPMDLLIGHSLLEIANACVVALLFLIVPSLAGYEMMPHHYFEALLAFGATILLGFGFGILNGAIAMMLRAWVTGYSLVIVIVYLTSGALVEADGLPEEIRQLLAINPVFDCVEWMRAAFLDINSTPTLGKSYVLACGIGALLLGLALERFSRGRILSAR